MWEFVKGDSIVMGLWIEFIPLTLVPEVLPFWVFLLRLFIPFGFSLKALSVEALGKAMDERFTC